MEETYGAVNDFINRKILIRFKLFMNYYHNGENSRNADIVKIMGIAKSEVSACVSEMINQGYLEDAGGRKKRLTENGYTIAEEYHRRYEFAHILTRAVYKREEDAVKFAELIALTQGDELFDIDRSMLAVSVLAEKMKDYAEFDGKKLCELADSGTYPVNLQFMTIPDTKSKLRHGDIMPEGGNVLTDADIHNFRQRHSMADDAFMHPAYLRFEDGKGYLCLHRVTIHKAAMGGEVMEGKAREIKYYDGEKFVDCPFVDDAADIPLDHFYFNRCCNQYRGKLIMQFSCTVGDAYMPVSEALVEIAL